jgi:hypothetical protein
MRWRRTFSGLGGSVQEAFYDALHIAAEVLRAVRSRRYRLGPRRTGSLPRNSSGRQDMTFSISIYGGVGLTDANVGAGRTLRSFFSFAVSFGLPGFFFTPDLEDRLEVVVVSPA